MFQSRLSLSTALLAVILLLVAQAKLFAAEEAAKIAPDPDVQKKIQAVSEAMLNKEKANDGAEKTFRALRALEELASFKLIEQLIWHHSKATDVHEGMTLTMVLSYLQLRPEELIMTTIPYMDIDPATRLGAGVDEVLDLAEHTHRKDTLNFEIYIRYIYRHFQEGTELPDQPIRRMMELSPQQAIQDLGAAYYRIQPEPAQAILKDWRVIDDYLWKGRFGFLKTTKPDPEVTTALTQLAKNDNWWVRLYVAEMIEKHPTLSTPDLKKQIAEDKHPAVTKPARRKSDREAARKAEATKQRNEAASAAEKAK